MLFSGLFSCFHANLFSIHVCFVQKDNKLQLPTEIWQYCDKMGISNAMFHFHWKQKNYLMNPFNPTPGILLIKINSNHPKELKSFCHKRVFFKSQLLIFLAWIEGQILTQISAQKLSISKFTQKSWNSMAWSGRLREGFTA